MYRLGVGRGRCLRLELDATNAGRQMPPARPPLVAAALLMLPNDAVNVVTLFSSRCLDFIEMPGSVDLGPCVVNGSTIQDIRYKKQI